MNKAKFLLLLIAIVYAGSAFAQWVETQGSAVVSENGYVEARDFARQEAIQKAIQEYERLTGSYKSLVNGRLVTERIPNVGQVIIRDEQVKDERMEGHKLVIDLAVDLERELECGQNDGARYKKSVAVLGFSLQVPEQASVGGLYDVDRGLSKALGDALGQYNSLVVFEREHDASYEDFRNAPTSLDEQRSLTHTLQYAKQLNVQFVVSGVIRDLGLVNPKAYSSSFWRESIKFFAQANERRRFSVDLFVHDGLSGELVWQENFATEGKWTPSLDEETGFSSQEFWQLDYGKSVAKLVETMAFGLDQQVRCQPFMTRIARVDGKTLHFGTGARSGLRPGDQLSVYRTYNYVDAQQKRGIELNNTKTVLTVSQVHPNFSSGTVSVDPGRLNIQQDDVLIAW